MDTCLHCNEPISQTPGKRKRIFCSDACRSAHWAKKEVVPDSWQEKYYNLKALYDPLLIRVAEQEKQLKDGLALYNNQTATIFKLEAEISRLQPLAESHQQRMNGIAEAVKMAPKQTLTTTSNEVTKITATEIRIAELEKELANPPKNPQIGLSIWKKIRQTELQKLKSPNQ